MKGKNCVALAMDRRLGAQFKTISMNFQRVFQMTDKILAGFIGLGGDVQTLAAELKAKLNLYSLKENRSIAPKTLASMLSHLQYKRRFSPYFIEPIIAGLTSDNEPYLATADSIGCMCDNDGFFCIGTGSENMLGICESFYQDGLEADDLFEVISQALLSGLDRDAFSGWGAVVFIITPAGITAKTLKARMD
jgi:20S proteasome subunit beta 3